MNWKLSILSFLEAIGWAKRRNVVLPDEYYDAKQIEMRGLSFSIKGLAILAQIADIKASLDEALATGARFDEWQTKAAIALTELPESRRELIYRNAMQNAYNAGRYDQISRNKRTRPLMMYDAINDSRTRPDHRALDGFIAPVDDPVWSTIFPPNGHRCRCTAISLTENQAKKRGWTGQTQVPKGRADIGWDSNPAEYFHKSMSLLDKALATQTWVEVSEAVRTLLKE